MTELELFQELEKVTHYDPVKKTVKWAVPGRGRTVGKEVGTNCLGYRVVQFKGAFIRVHRFIWWIDNGVVPDIVDHITHVTDDNTKLRDCTHQQNMFNRRISKKNKCGYKGVVYHQGKYRAVIRKDGKQVHIGSYDTPQEASDAYYAKAVELFGEFSCRG